jgi:hypothetical protein
MIIVGIDVASEKHDYFMLRKETGESFSSSAITIPNNEAGYKKLHNLVASYAVICFLLFVHIIVY